jgi:hypothetical protein
LQAGGHRFDPDWLHQPPPESSTARVMSAAFTECNADRMGAKAPTLFKKMADFVENAMHQTR